MKLATENYKGIAISAVQKVIGNKPMVEASALVKGRKINAVAKTKALAVPKVKSKIDSMLR
jgi:hypothetical protein